MLELHNAGGIIGRSVVPMSDLGEGAGAGRPASLNDVPLLAVVPAGGEGGGGGGGGVGGGGGGGEEVGKVTVTVRAWQRAALLAQREKEIAGGFDAGGGLGVGGDGAWMLSAMATDMAREGGLITCITRVYRVSRTCITHVYHARDKIFFMLTHVYACIYTVTQVH